MIRNETHVMFMSFKNSTNHYEKIIEGPLLKNELEKSIKNFINIHDCDINKVCILEEDKFKKKFPETYKFFFKQNILNFLECFICSFPTIKTLNCELDEENRIFYTPSVLLIINDNNISLSFSLCADSGFVAFFTNELNDYIKDANITISIDKTFYLSPLDKKIFFEEEAYSRYLSENFITHKERLN